MSNVLEFVDYRYWDDPSDEFKDGEGSLLPLWKFTYDKTKKHDVTDLCFNSQYYDLFAVAFGSSIIEPQIYSMIFVLYVRFNGITFNSELRQSNDYRSGLSFLSEKSILSGMGLHDRIGRDVSGL